MRCPKCGYHSFDHLDCCKKCGGDLAALKVRCKLQGYMAPLGDAEAAAPEPPVIKFPAEAEAEGEAIDFGFDILDDAENAAFLQHLTSDHRSATPSEIDTTALDFGADGGLNLDQPLTSDSERVPGDGLPKLDDQFDF